MSVKGMMWQWSTVRLNGVIAQCTAAKLKGLTLSLGAQQTLEIAHEIVTARKERTERDTAERLARALHDDSSKGLPP